MIISSRCQQHPLFLLLLLFHHLPLPTTPRLAGGFHTCTFLPDDTVKCWGNNKFGQLGLGDWQYRGNSPLHMGHHLPPIDIGTDVTIRHVSPGDSHTCVILSDATLKCFGRNSIGQLGIGDGMHRGNTPGSMGDRLPAVDLGGGLGAIDVSAGVDHTCAILEDRTLKCWGRNWYGQLGRGDNATVGRYADDMGTALPVVDLGMNDEGVNHTVKMVSCGQFHTCAVLEEGSLKCWGQNLYGQLGLGDNVTRGDVSYQMGDNLTYVDLGMNPQTGLYHTAKYVSAGYYHTCAILDDDSLKCWGRNLFGQLGLGHNKTMGDDEYEMGDYLPRIDLGRKWEVMHVSAGYYHTCARIDEVVEEEQEQPRKNAMKCWGKNWYGQLGQGDKLNRGTEEGQMGDNLPPIDLGISDDMLIKEMIAGSDHSCAILEDNTVKCWGHNLIGTLGYGDSLNRGDEPYEMGTNLTVINVGVGDGEARPYNSYNYAVAPDQLLEGDDDFVKFHDLFLSPELTNDDDADDDATDEDQVEDDDEMTIVVPTTNPTKSTRKKKRKNKNAGKKKKATRPVVVASDDDEVIDLDAVPEDDDDDDVSSNMASQDNKFDTNPIVVVDDNPTPTEADGDDDTTDNDTPLIPKKKKMPPQTYDDDDNDDGDDDTTDDATEVVDDDDDASPFPKKKKMGNGQPLKKKKGRGKKMKKKNNNAAPKTTSSTTTILESSTASTAADQQQAPTLPRKKINKKPKNKAAPPLIIETVEMASTTDEEEVTQVEESSSSVVVDSTPVTTKKKNFKKKNLMKKKKMAVGLDGATPADGETKTMRQKKMKRNKK